jgi:hypothetical protein
MKERMRERSLNNYINNIMKLKKRSEEIKDTPHSACQIIDMIEEGTKENITIQNAIIKY